MRSRASRWSCRSGSSSWCWSSCPTACSVAERWYECEAQGPMSMPSDGTGATVEPALGTLPETTAAPAPPPGTRPPLWPPLPSPSLFARLVIGVAPPVVSLYAPFYFTPENNRIISQAIYLSTAAMGLNLLTAFTAQVSIGHGAFVGVGAFTTAMLMVDHGWTF